MGLLANWTNGFGRERVSGLRRVPYPPTRMSAFIALLCCMVSLVVVVGVVCVVFVLLVCCQCDCLFSFSVNSAVAGKLSAIKMTFGTQRRR